MKILKEIFWKINNVVRRQPMTCRISRSANIRHTWLEGYNKVTTGVKLTNSEIGYGTFIGRDSNIDQCKIGRYCACAAGFEVLRGEHPTHEIASIHPALYSAKGQYGFTYVDQSIYEEFKYIEEGGKMWSVIVGNDVWIASDVKVCENVKIGDGAIAMSGAVVTKNVPPYAIVGGIPARIVGYRFSEGQIAALLQLQWWDRGEKWIKEHAQYFDDVENLIRIGRKEGLINDGK